MSCFVGAGVVSSCAPFQALSIEYLFDIDLLGIHRVTVPTSTGVLIATHLYPLRLAT